MLVLSRKKGESIMIGDNIEIVVLGVEGDTVKVGVRAPKQVDVFRKEVYETIRAENREASSTRFSAEDLKSLWSRTKDGK